MIQKQEQSQIIVIVITVVSMMLASCATSQQGNDAQTEKSTGVQPSSGEVKVSEKDGAEMVKVPAGEFLMGSTQEQAVAAVKECGSDCEIKWFDSETPQHTVNLDEYWIYKTEVTNAQYAKCVGAGGCSEPGKTANYKDSSYAQHPVMYVDWEKAKGYCAWAGGRLPSEAEWEKAARGTDGRTYPWGNQEPTCDLVNYVKCGGKTKAVGNLAQGASPYGALDMAGNVWEWVEDWDAEGYNANAPKDNPSGPSSGKYRVMRGGSFGNESWLVRSASRLGDLPASWYIALGFRCLRLP